jgi:predicted nucleotidyltransferase component of viral defense system
MSTPSLSAAAFRASVRDRLKTEAKKRGRPVNELQREFVLQRFLSRVFAAPEDQWVLKGGTGLLIRLPGARYSRDLDLLHLSESLEVAIDELKELSRGPGGDPFSFVVRDPVRMSGGVAGVNVKVDTYLGAAVYCVFPIDLSTELTFVAQVEHRRPRPVLEVPGVDPLPEFTLYPLPDQVADKVCAMYERHGPAETPSSRFRDLVDLVLIVSNFELDAAQTIRALVSESRRRDLLLPARLQTPDPTWLDGYRAAARDTSLLSQLHELPAAWLAAGECLDPLLTRKITTGVWKPEERRWRR